MKRYNSELRETEVGIHIEDVESPTGEFVKYSDVAKMGALKERLQEIALGPGRWQDQPYYEGLDEGERALARDLLEEFYPEEETPSHDSE